MTRKALILYHGKRERAETFTTIFEELGWEQREIFTPEESLAEIDPLEPDLLVVMGGPMGVYELDKYPFLEGEIKFLKTRLERDLPVLGICLGSQLIAAALGGSVYQGRAGKEIGWAPLELSIAGENHPVRHLSGEKTNMFHWHGDTFQLPQSATLLASSMAYENQIYAVGNALALQCHPEVTAPQLEKWLAHEMSEVGESILCKDIERIREQTEKHVKILNAQTRLMMNEWLQSVGLK
jgi:GMP synthase (glutamine-hydrolysing)